MSIRSGVLIMRYSEGFNGKTVEAFSNFLNMHLEVRLHLADYIVDLPFYFVNGFGGQGRSSSRTRSILVEIGMFEYQTTHNVKRSSTSAMVALYDASWPL